MATNPNPQQALIDAYDAALEDAFKELIRALEEDEVSQDPGVEAARRNAGIEQQLTAAARFEKELARMNQAMKIAQDILGRTMK